MIDISAEQLLTLSQAARSLPGKVNVSTLWRWYQRGCRGVRLETVVIGGRRYTSKEALERFAAATTAARNGEQPTSRTSKQRQRATDTANFELEKAGW